MRNGSAHAKMALPAAIVLIAVFAVLCPREARAATIYVSTTGTNDAANRYNTWEGAATNINEAVAIAAAGETVLVSNGVYAVTNTLVVTNFTVQSVNGPDYTTVYKTFYPSNIIFVVSHSNAWVSGFKLTNAQMNIYGCGQCLELYAGTVSNCVVTDCPGWSSLQAGVVKINDGLVTRCVISNNQSRSHVIAVRGGVLQDSVIYGNHTYYDPAPLCVGGAGIVRRCSILNNLADQGSGPYVIAMDGSWSSAGGTLENCLVWGNKSLNGAIIGMAGGSRLLNCTVASNTAQSARYAVEYLSGTIGITNCIAYSNSALGQVNSTTIPKYSCAPELTTGVNGNRSDPPKFINVIAGNCRLDFGSPCIDSGTNIGITVDILGTNRDANCDMGAYERVAAAAGPLQVAFSGLPLTGIGSVTSVFTAVVDGGNTNITSWEWDFNNDGIGETNGADLRVVTNVLGPGRHSICLRVANTTPETAAATNLNYVAVQSAGNDVYVSMNGSGTFPFDAWEKATNDFEDAFRNATHGGSTVWVSNGLYAVSAQLALNTNKAVRGVGERAAVVLYRSTSGYFPIFNMSHASAWVSGVTISNAAGAGAGACFSMSAGTVSNCLMTKTTTGIYPDGVAFIYGGLMTGCLVSNNAPRSTTVFMQGGVLEDSIITGTTAGHDNAPLDVGYGPSAGTVRRCKIIDNTPPGNIAGAVRLRGASRMESCLIRGNRGPSSTYGAIHLDGGTMVNCTITSNGTSSGAAGVTWSGGAMTNCIVYGNDPAFPNYTGSLSAAWYSCAPELTNSAQGNVTGAPLFLAATNADFRLGKGSPCINTGTNLPGSETALDLDGLPRLRQTIVDMGAYESAYAVGSAMYLR